MTYSEFRRKHPKIFNQILERGARAERIQVIYKRIKAKNPNDGTPFFYGDRKHVGLINRELPLLG
jgi:hypothetical protein